jgi:hypothetical protein
MQHFHKSSLPDFKKIMFWVQHFCIYNNVTYITVLQNCLTGPQFFEKSNQLVTMSHSCKMQLTWLQTNHLLVTAIVTYITTLHTLQHAHLNSKHMNF